MTAVLYGADAADPAGPLPGAVACGYIGGHADYHTWTDAQWAMQLAPARLPIWVAAPHEDPASHAAQCVNALRALGVPKDVCYALDAELLDITLPGWVDQFADVTGAAGYACLPYDSLARIFTWPPRRGYFIANPTGRRHLYEHPHAVGTQWAFGSLGQCPPGMDLDAFTPGLRFWTP